MGSCFHFFFFFFDSLQTEYPIAAACLTGFPAKTSARMFFERFLLLQALFPLMRGIIRRTFLDQLLAKVFPDQQ